jgi:hypothetical protein
MFSLIQSEKEIEKNGGFIAVTIRNWFTFFFKALMIGSLLDYLLKKTFAPYGAEFEIASAFLYGCPFY